MKKLLFYFGIISCAAAMMVSCGGEATCDVTEVRAGIDGTQGVITFDGGACEVLYSPDWVNVYPKENTARYFVAQNKTSELREGCIVLACSKSIFSIPVIQGTRASYLVLSEKAVNMDHDGDKARVAVITNGGKVSIKSIPQVEATLKGDYLTLVSEKNEGKKISGRIKVTSGKLVRYINVTIEANPDAITDGSEL